MSYVAAAAAAGGIASSVGGGLLGKGSAKKAKRRAQVAYQEGVGILGAGREEAGEVLGAGYEEAVGRLVPYAAVGESALGQLAHGLGFDVPGFEDVEAKGGLLERFDAEKFEKDPGYEFVRDEGERAVERSAAARGSVLSGSTLKALTRFNQGLAAQQYQQAYERDIGERKFGVETLAGVSRMGQQAAERQGMYGISTTQQQAQNIFDAAQLSAAARMSLGGLGAQLELQKGQFARQTLGGVSQSIQSFFS